MVMYYFYPFNNRYYTKVSKMNIGTNIGINIYNIFLTFSTMISEIAIEYRLLSL